MGPNLPELKLLVPMNTRFTRFLAAVACLASAGTLLAQATYTAKDRVDPYQGRFHGGINYAYVPPWDNFTLTDLAAGAPEHGVLGLGVNTARPGLQDKVLGEFGYDVSQPFFDYMEDKGVGELTAIIGFPADKNRDYPNKYCNEVGSDGKVHWNAHFQGIYEPIWDDGANGTPYNDDNLFAKYCYETVDQYKDQVRYWEVWNEPGLYKGDPAEAQKFWGGPEYPGSWWVNDPEPCDYVMYAPIEHYIRVMRISWEVIKTIAPDDYVVISGLGSESFLDAIMRNTDEPTEGKITADYPHRGGAYFDVLGYHTYPHIDGSVYLGPNSLVRHSDGAADGMIERRLTAYNAVAEGYGYDGTTYPRKLNIATEVNVPRLTTYDRSFGSTEAQVNFMAKALISFKVNNVHAAHFYSISDRAPERSGQDEFDAMGMYKYLPDFAPYTQEAYPQAYAFKTANDFILETDYDAARTAALNAPDGVRAYALRRDDGSYVYAVWAETRIDKSEEASATFVFPADVVGGDGKVERYAWDYARSQRSSTVQAGAEIQLTGRPEFFTAGSGTTPTNDAPLATLQASATDVETGDDFTVTVNWTEDVTGLTTSDFEVSGASVTGLSGTGDSYTLSLRAGATAGAATVSLPANVATDDGGLGNPQSNTATVTITEPITGGGGGVDLELAMGADKTTVGIYKYVTFELTLTNTGNEDATGVEVAFPKPADYVFSDDDVSAGRYSDWTGKWRVGDVGANQTVTASIQLFTLTDEARVARAEVLSVDQDDADSTPGNRGDAAPEEDDEAAVGINGGVIGGGGGGGTTSGVDLEVALSSSNGGYRIYERLPLQVTVRNTGDETATGVEVAVPFPENFVYSDKATDKGNYSLFHQAWRLGDLAPGATATLDLTLFSLQGTGTVDFYAEVTKQGGGQDADSSPGNGNGSTANEDDEAVLPLNPTQNQGLASAPGATLLEVVPAPNSRQQRLVYTVSVEGASAAQLVDLLGRTVRTVALENAPGLHETMLDATGLAPGVYYLTVTGGGDQRSRPIVVQ